MSNLPVLLQKALGSSSCCNCNQQVDCSCVIACSLSHRVKAGTATLVGFSEYISPSTPPKKFLRKEFTGTYKLQQYSNTDPCTIAWNLCQMIFTGEGDYDPNTGLITTNSGDLYCDDTFCPCGGSEPRHVPWDASYTVPGYYIPNTNITQTATDTRLVPGSPNCYAYSDYDHAVNSG
jgi:hypothetical protein